MARSTRLPPEVLSDIFFETISHDFHDTVVRQERNCFRRPLPVSQVCRFWRQAAISDGRLWGYIRVDSANLPKDLRAVFDLFLSRSKRAPLFLFVKIDFRHLGDRARKHVVYLINTLAAQQRRWREAILDCTRTNCLKTDEVLMLDLTNMPMLSSLYLYCDENVPITIDLRHSSDLRGLRLCCDFELPESKVNAPPLLRLTWPCELYFRNISAKRAALRSCLDFLETAPLIRQVTIRFHFCGHDFSRHRACAERRIVLPGLLYTEYRGFSESHTVLDSLTLPSLKAFSLIATEQGKSLVNLFRRSAPPLRTLNIECAATPEETIIEVFRLIPTLQECSLYRISVSSRFLRELVAGNRSSQQLVCPELIYLNVLQGLERPAEDSAVFIEALISMVESRARHLNTFSKISLRDEYTNLDVSTLRDLDLRDLRYPSFEVW